MQIAESPLRWSLLINKVSILSLYTFRSKKLILGQKPNGVICKAIYRSEYRRCMKY